MLRRASLVGKLLGKRAAAQAASTRTTPSWFYPDVDDAETLHGPFMLDGALEEDMVVREMVLTASRFPLPLSCISTPANQQSKPVLVAKESLHSAMKCELKKLHGAKLDATSDMQWECPLEAADPLHAAASTPLPAGWGRGEHEGSPCYINLMTRGMQWEFPLEAASESEGEVQRPEGRGKPAPCDRLIDTLITHAGFFRIVFDLLTL